MRKVQHCNTHTKCNLMDRRMRHRNISGKKTQNHPKREKKMLPWKKHGVVSFQFSSHSPHGRATFADKFWNVSGVLPYITCYSNSYCFILRVVGQHLQIVSRRRILPVTWLQYYFPTCPTRVSCQLQGVEKWSWIFFWGWGGWCRLLLIPIWRGFVL